jgi:glycosyltransferase involved in cell wall biosynthesis
MRIAYVTAGAGGMFCGSCMRDNTLAAALARLGHDALLVPTYTPLTTDEPDVSQKRVFLGGINVYLQEKLDLFRHTPWFLDRLLDSPRLLRWASRFAVKTRAEDLGALTASVLRGEHGHQKKEVDKLVSWLASDVKPELVNLTSALLSGMVGELKRRLKVPVLVSLQGDDIFLEALPEPYRARCLALVREHCRAVDGFLATCAYYADFMAGYFEIPREKVDVVYAGINLAGHGAPKPDRSGKPFTVGYFARLAPEKGLHVLVEAFRLLRQHPAGRDARLHVSGWLGANNRPYFDEQLKRLEGWGLRDAFAHVDCPDHDSKVRFLRDLDVLSVPTVYREPKGLYVLEALANAVPVVQPRHGSFPELLGMTGGGLLVNPEEPADLARALGELAADRARAAELGFRGQAAVRERFHAARMAEDTAAVYAKHLARAGGGPP